MMQGRCGFGFALEALAGFLVAQKVGGQEFERDRAFEFGVVGFVDHTHPALAELAGDLVMRDGLAEHLWSNCSVLLRYSEHGLLVGLEWRCVGVDMIVDAAC